VTTWASPPIRQMQPLTPAGSWLAMSKENAVLVGSDDAGLYNLDDAELQAYEDEWEAEAWDQQCSAMRRAEQNFGY